MQKILPLLFILIGLILPELNAQNKPASGKITEADGTDIPGVTIMLKGTNDRTVTNVEGQFNLTCLPTNQHRLWQWRCRH